MGAPPASAGLDVLAAVPGGAGRTVPVPGSLLIQPRLFGPNPAPGAAEPEEGSDADGDGLADQEELLLGTNPSLVDSEGDGLTDYEEVLLGTSPLFADSDGDLITDTLEVRGYVYTATIGTETRTTTFYGDPLEADTNRDGIGDWTEWHASGAGDRPGDTDGDGVPDIVSRDNDGDGVPDDLDLSPFQTSRGAAVFDRDNPFSLVVENLAPGKPSYVEFQLRPSNSEHLWYAFNVLDWPEDRQGQIQDGDGLTYADLDSGAVDPAGAGTNGNGDVKMVPMLEIVVPGEGDNLPPASTLRRLYGVHLQDMAALGMGEGKLIYLPLQLVVDSAGGARVAFRGKMLYLPGETWAEAHQVRLVWVVQALLDACAEDGWENGQCNVYNAEHSNQPQIIHRYDDEWYLTGLSVREDGGQEAGIIWEDPARDGNLDDDDALIRLTQVLDATFLSGRDCDAPSAESRCQGDGERDVTVGELSRRLGQAADPEARWNLPDVLAMETFSYTHQDEALLTLVLTGTRQILEANFTDRWSEASPITPTLLFVREEVFRASNLDALAGGEGLRWGGELRVDMGAEGIQPITMASVSWKPYHYSTGAGWENCPVQTYWQELESRYLGLLAGEGDAGDALGKLFLFQFYYVTGYSGVSEVVQTGDLLAPGAVAPWRSPDAELAETILEEAGGAVKSIVSNLDATTTFYGETFAELVNKKGLYSLPAGDLTPETLKAIGEIDRLRAESGSGRARSNAVWARDAIPDQPLKAEKGSGLGAAAIAGLGLTAVNLGLLVADQYTDSEAVEVAADVSTYTVGVVGVVLGAVEIAQSARLVYTMVNSGMSLSKALSANSAIVGASKTAARVGLVVSLAITLAFFTVGLVEGLQAGANAMQISTLVAQAVAQIIMAILMFVLSATIIGNIIVGLIIIFDTIMSLLGLEEYTSAALLAKALYGYSTIAEPNCAMGESHRSFAGPGQGIVGGNSMVLTQTFTATATMKDPDDWRAETYLETLWTDGVLWGSDVRCELDIGAQALPAGSTLWERMVHDHTYRGWAMHRAEAKAIDDVRVELEAGINYTPPISLNMGYEVPVANCWWVGLLIPPICYVTSLDGDSSTDLGALMPMDVLPATVDEFYWWDELGTQQDHDGDGLRAIAVNGNDPDDTRWDADGDGLSDAYELERRSRGGQEGGVRPSLLSDDTDGDGLSDADEIRLGTFPNRRDSDGDGLKDGQEVWHYDLNEGAWSGGWEYTYTLTTAPGVTETHSIRVTSDPLAADTDGDGLNDGVEQALGENPRAWTPNPQQLQVQVDDADGIAGPGQTLVYTATLYSQIRMDPGYFITGMMTTTLPSALGGDVVTRAYNIYQGQAVSVVRALPVGGAGSEGQVAITSEARGWLHDGNITDTYRLDPDPAGLLTSTPATAPAFANVAASRGAGDLFAVASAEGTGAVNLRAANQVLPPPANARGDQGCGPGVRPHAPGIACANNGTCLTAWSNVHYDHNCTDIHLNVWRAISQGDGSGEGDTGEYYLRVNGTRYPSKKGLISTWWNLTTGVYYGLDITQRFCGTAALEIKDYDDWSADDSLGTHSVSYCSAGSGSHEFGTGGGQGVIKLWWVVDEQRKDGVYGRIMTKSGPATDMFAMGGPDWDLHRQQPVVASDGSHFLAVWQEGKPGDRRLFARQVATDGVAGPAHRLVIPGTGYDGRPALAWAGDRYILVWRSDMDYSAHMAYLDAGGNLLDGSHQLLASGASAVQVAANPEAGQALVVYSPVCDTGRCLKGRLVDVRGDSGPAGSVGPEIHLVDRLGYSRAPSVAYEPKYGGWLVSWPATARTLAYVPLSTAGEPLLVKEGRGPQASFQALRGTMPMDENLFSQALACSPETTDYAQCALVASSNDRLYLQPLGLEFVPALVGPLTTTVVTSVTIDAVPPTATVTSLVDGQSVAASGTLVIGGDAADATSGVARVQISLNGGPWQDAEGAESWVYAWQVPGTDGPVTLSSRATDLVGNTGPATSITVTIDRTPPDVSLAAGDIVPAARQAGTWSLSLRGPAGDGHSDVVRVEALVTPHGNGWQPATLEGETWRLGYALSGVQDGIPLLEPNGNYTVQVWAVDAAGNESAAPAVRTVRVDAAPPEITVTYPATYTAAITGTVSLSGTMVDPGPVAAGPAGLEVSFTPAGGSPARWLPATLDRTGPGVPATGWRLPVPGDLEGFFQIDLRAADAVGNSSGEMLRWNPWRGEIDTLAPRVAITATLRGAGQAAQTVYEGRAEDLNLSMEALRFPCEVEAADARAYDDAWWIAVTGDTRRPYRLAPSCIVNGFQEGPPTLEACDVYGHCAATGGALLGQPAALASAVLTPAHEAVLTATAPISLAIGAFARDGLDALSLTVNGVEEGSVAWAGQVSDTITATTWTPPGEGHFVLVTAATDRAGNVQPEPQPITITVDVEAPAVALSTAVLTTAHRLSFRRVALSGSADDSVGLQEVAVSVDGGTWETAGLDGGTWHYPWSLGPGESEPDGEAHTISVRATDGAGHTAEATETVTVDLVPPAPMTLTLAYESGDGLIPLDVGGIIREMSATLGVGWPESSLGAGWSNVLAGWSTAITPAVESLAPAVGEHRQALAEPQALYAHVVARDENGNSRAQTAGPVYLDGPLTPDLVADLGYHGWMQSGCSLVGADREMGRHAEAGATLTGTQTLHASWDREALRLAWTGADWNVSGDLFVYLDTRAGEGAATAYDPYGLGPEIRLPAGMAADYLLWVEDEKTAALLTVSAAGGWQPAAGGLAGLQVALDAGRARTDVLLPFDVLGLEPGGGGGLSLVALASEEDALRLWAAMPDKNPLNSVLAANPLAVDYLAQDFALTQRYRWPMLGDGQCPNQGQFADADLRVSLGAEPPGVELGFLEHDLPGLLIPGQPLDGGDMNGEPDLSLPRDHGFVLLADGQTVTYSLRYANLGAAIAPGAVVTLTARGALELAGGSPVTVTLDAVSGTIAITGTVNAALDGQSAELDAEVADATHGASDWLWVQHGVDTEPPVGLAFLVPGTYVGPGLNQAGGVVSDPSGVPTIVLEVLGVDPPQLASLAPASRAEVTGTAEVQVGTIITCTDTTPWDGTWACPWDAGGAGDGTQIRLRARAIDGFGSSGDWTEPVTVTVDATPPAVALGPETAAALGQDRLLGPDDLWFSGQVADERQAAGVSVCAAAAEGGAPICQAFEATPGESPWVADWRALAPVLADSDGVPQTFVFYGYDGVGNRTAVPVTASARVDIVAPGGEVRPLLSRAVQGASSPVLAGTVRDGTGVERLQAYVAGPGLQVTWYDQDDDGFRFDGEAWALEARFGEPGAYSLGAEAWDAAGNVRRWGPFPVEVVPPAADLSLALSAAPVPATSRLPLDYKARVANLGPQLAATTVATFTLPAGEKLLRATRGCDQDGDVLVCALGDLAPGRSRDITWRIQVPMESTRALACQGTVSSGTLDPEPGNNRRSLLTAVRPYSPDGPLVCDGPNLLANGGFEEGFRPDGVARSWTGFHTGGGAEYGYRDDRWDPVVSKGVHSQLIAIDTIDMRGCAECERMAGIRQAVGLLPGVSYELSVDAIMRERGAYPLEDPYRYMVGWGFSAGGGTDPAGMAFREWLPMRSVYPMAIPGAWFSYRTRFEAPGEDVTIWLYALKKWATLERELDVNLDNATLRLCRPAPVGGGSPH